MSEFEEKLNAVLSSPETMEQIMALANSLTGKSGAGTEGTSPAGAANAAAAAASGEGSPVPAAQPSGAATGSDAGGSPLSLLQGLDPSALAALSRLFREYRAEGDERTALLNALRPFLRPERQAKVERALQITRISRVIREALRLFREGGHV